MRQTDAGKVKPMKVTTQSFLCATLYFLGVFCVHITVYAGIPEPDTILYGKVINNYQGNAYVITRGSLEWRIREKTGERRTFIFHAALESLKEGDFSYQLKIPHEAAIAIAGMEVPAEMVALTTDKRQYDHVEVLVDGISARILPPASKFIRTAQQLRSQSYRVDLEVVFELLDSDGDGMPDWWEERYGLNTFLADAHGDGDGDGATNLKEFLDGSDPTKNNRQPTLATSKIVVYEAGTVGVCLRTIDSDSLEHNLTYTLKLAPQGGKLYFRDGSGEPDEQGVRPGKVLQAGDTFTQDDVDNGKIQFKHQDVGTNTISFDLTVRDEDESHSSSSGTVAVDILRPTATDGSGASLWLDVNYDVSRFSPGDLPELTLWTDRSGPKTWIKDPDPSDYPNWQDKHFNAISWDDAVPLKPSGLRGQPALVLDGEHQFDLPYTNSATVFPQGDRTLFAVFRAVGAGTQHVLSSTHFNLGICGEGEGAYAGQVRYATENWSVYSHKRVVGDWVLATVCQEGDKALIELNGHRVAGPTAVEQKALLGTDPVVGAKSIWHWDNEKGWQAKDSEKLEGDFGEILAFNYPLANREREKINTYLLSKWFDYVVWDRSAEARNQEISVPSSFYSWGTIYQNSFVPEFGKDRSYVLLGGAGNDTLWGGGEADILVGGRGDDTLIGGSGPDIFVWNSVDEGNDTLEDFNTTQQDVLDLSRLLKKSSNDLRHYVRLTTDGTHSTVRIDVNGDGSGYTDMEIKLCHNVFRDEDLYSLWANGHFITGTVRFPLEVNLSVVDSVAIENTGDAAVFSIGFSGDHVPQTLSLPFSLGGSAKRSEDFLLEAQLYNTRKADYELFELTGFTIPVRLKPGDKDLKVRLVPISESHTESDEDVKLTLLPLNDFYDLGIAGGRVTIEDLPLWVTIEAIEPLAVVDEDVSGAFLVKRSGGLEENLTVRFDINGTASNGLDYAWIPGFLTFDSGQSSATISVVPSPGVSLHNGVENVEIAVIPEAISPYRVLGLSAATVTIVETRMNMAGWRARHFDGETVSMEAFAVEDRDEDGIPHLLEYAFGLDPKTVDFREECSGWPRFDVRDLHLAVQFRQIHGVSDIEYTVEVSDDLIDWQSGTQYVKEVFPSVNEGETRVVGFRDRLSLSNCEKRFMRVRVGMKPQGPVMMSEVFGWHRWRVVNEGTHYCLASVPFMKPALVQGRLDGVLPEEGILIDDESAFGRLDGDAMHMLLIRSGPIKGARFTVEASAEDQRRAHVEGSDDLENLDGDEWFSLHPVYDLSEFFPVDGAVLPAHTFDVLAGQVHFYGEDGCRKYWLSNGDLTENKACWAQSVDGRPVALTNLSLYPGIGFVIYHPAPDQNVEIEVAGEVPDVLIRKPVRPEYNFLGMEYNMSRTDEHGHPSVKLRDLRLTNSGFHMGETVDATDLLYIWDPSEGDYGPTCRLFNHEGTPEWVTEEAPPQDAGDREVLPGTGLVIWNEGEAYIWLDGE